MGDVETLDRIEAYYSEYSSWPEVGRAVAFEALENGQIDAVTPRHVNRYQALAHALYCGRVKDSPTLRRALGVRKSNVFTLAFRFRDRAQFEAARRAVDAGGSRVGWLMSVIDKETTDD